MLTGVSETALMTLQVRANEARRPDPIIDDPMAIQLADSIDYDFAKFGFARRQDMAVRALAFDRRPAATCSTIPKPPWSRSPRDCRPASTASTPPMSGNQFRWLTVDLPPMIDLRRKLLPASDRVEMCAQSALDFSWMDGVDTENGVFITAEGLLMYLQPEEAWA